MTQKKPLSSSSEISDPMRAEFETFELGRLLATPGALACLRRFGLHPLALIAMHAQMEWGAIDAEDALANVQAITDGGRILSIYRVEGQVIHVITEAVGENGHRAWTMVQLATES